MSTPFASQVGSGTTPYTYGILAPDQRGALSGANGVRYGIQVVVANPEDIVAVDAWAASGVVVGTTPVQIFGPGINTLPRTRRVIVENLGGQDLHIAPTEAGATIADGYTVPAPSAGVVSIIELPLLHNNEIWARSESATTTVKLLIY